MSVAVEFPSALQRFVGNRKMVEVSPGTVKTAFEALAKDYSGLKDQLYDENGKIRSFVNIYLNDEDIRYSDNLDTPLKDGDVIQIVPSIAGGK